MSSSSRAEDERRSAAAATAAFSASICGEEAIACERARV
jgi:hypothetical protein